MGLKKLFKRQSKKARTIEQPDFNDFKKTEIISVDESPKTKVKNLLAKALKIIEEEL